MDLVERELDMQNTLHKKKLDPKVLIFMVTYNHEKYIAQAIESVMIQKTSFDYLLVIGEDCSTDNTLKICINLKQNYPDKILLLNNTENLGPMINALNVYKKCFSSSAKYVAMLEGDDYWCDENKLQKQVDFLDANKDHSICFHRVYELGRGELQKLSNLNSCLYEETYTIKDLAKENIIHTPSVVFRNGLVKELPAWFKTRL